MPAWRALRAAYPEARITLIGLPWAQVFVERFRHYIDDFVELPGFPGLPEQPPRAARLPSFLAGMQERRFDLALQMHGDGTITNSLTVLLGACVNAGFYRPGQYCPDAKRFLPYPDTAPEVRRHLLLMASLGLPSRGEALEFPIRPEDRSAYAAMEEAQSLRRGAYVCLHAGARSSERRWPPEDFAVIGDALAARGLSVVLTGTQEEARLIDSVAAAMRAPSLKLAGRTDLGSLAVLVESARLVVCNDTAVSHLADALRVPSVVVATGSDASRWSPLDTTLHRVVSSTGPIVPAMVLASVAQVLEKERVYAA